MRDTPADRTLHTSLLRDASGFPSVTLIGPRQSGKSTLARLAFPEHRFIHLERPDLREHAVDDPVSLLSSGGSGLILDEVQNVPSLLSWVQVAIDEDPAPGRFVLTGSNQHALSAAISQSLAGRTAVSTLLPPDRSELLGFPDPPQTLLQTLWIGSFPRIHQAGLPADRWLASYVATYIERDVRAVLQIRDLTTFGTFLRLVAGRTSQELNASALGADAGITQPTARAWLSVLESSFLVHRLPAWSRNTRKQLIKRPKLTVVDSGLVCFLLGIRSPRELETHPLRGPIFESWVVTELLKQRLHRSLSPRMFHWRESRGLEVDLVIDDGPVLWLVEVKSGRTVARDWFGPLRAAMEQTSAENAHKQVRGIIVYGGDEASTRNDVQVVPWHGLHALTPS